MDFQNKPSSPEQKQIAELIAVLQDFVVCIQAKQPQDDSLYYDNADLKMMLNVSDSSLYRMRKAKKIPFEKILGRIYYHKSFFKKTFRS